MLDKLRFVAFVLVNILVAVIGTAIIETTVGGMFHPHSLGGILWKEWGLSIICAALLGFGAGRTWRSDVAIWTWVLPTAWLGAKVLLSTGSGPLLFQFSGEACVAGVRPTGCINWFVFAIPFVRSAFYSLGAYVSSIVHPVRRSEGTIVPPI